MRLVSGRGLIESVLKSHAVRESFQNCPNRGRTGNVPEFQRTKRTSITVSWRDTTRRGSLQKPPCAKYAKEEKRANSRAAVAPRRPRRFRPTVPSTRPPPATARPPSPTKSHSLLKTGCEKHDFFLYVTWGRAGRPKFPLSG